MQHLQPNSTLQGGKYRIEKVLGQGGFGITYLAEQVMLGRKVAVKEFFMKELCDRDESTSHVTLGTEGSRETVNRFREKFLKEARNIARLNHPNIVRIIDVFEENGTAYYVMEYAENGSLADKVKREGYLSEPVATRYILQAAEALDYVHQQKMNHLDVKPANIMLNEKDESVLIDFGLSKQYDATTGNQTSTTPVGISEGYAPMEQYKQGGVGEFSPETDIYALGATFFKLLTGVTPPSASDVNEDGVHVDELKAKGVSDNVIAVICKAMEGRKRDRMKSVQEFIRGLKSAQSIANDSIDEVTLMTGDETTHLTFEMQKLEEERKRKEAAAEVERKAQVEEKQNTKKAYEKESKDAQGVKPKNIWMGIVAAIIVIAGIVFAMNNSNSSSIETFTVNGVSFDMVKVEGGTFTMGATPEMKDPRDDEMPTHQVTLTNNYYIGKTEVTQALWKAVMGNNPSDYKGDNFPVEQVSWNDCQKFISKLNSLTGQNFRLPTEAEWEFAARGGNKAKRYQYSGSSNIEDVAWYGKNTGGNTTHAVATKKPNELGIYDMSGNVSELCSDWYGNYGGGSQTNPVGPSIGSERVQRGSTIFDNEDACRLSYRHSTAPDDYDFWSGFRLALSE